MTFIIFKAREFAFLWPCFINAMRSLIWLYVLHLHPSLSM